LPVGQLGGLDAAVFAIDPVTGGSELAFGIPCQQSGGSCQAEPSLFTYDFFRDRIWVSVPNPNGTGTADAFIPRLISVPSQRGTPAPIDPSPTCMNGYDIPRSEQGPYDPHDSATWAVGGSDTLYIQMEDDVTVRHVNSQTCAPAGPDFTHPKYSEAGSVENDQMVCDPITYGQGPGGTSVLWLRDAAPNTVQSYDIPGGACPFPTSLALTPRALSANSNQPVTSCAVLRKFSNGRPPLGGMTLSFALANQPVGSAVTDGGGQACVTFQTPPTGGNLPLVVRFAGTGALLPAQDSGNVVVVGPRVPPPPPVPPTGAIAPRPAGHPPAAVTQPVGQPQGLAQAQVQQQVQAQSQIQLQPGMSMEQEEQVQVTVQSLSGEKRTGILSAVSRQPSPVVVMILQLAAGLAMGIALLQRDRVLQVRRRLRPARSRKQRG
jgi:hypothetical protein